MQDGNNNDLFLSFAVQYSSGIQNGCSGLINTTTTTKKKPCKGFCSESKWAPTNLTNQTKSIVSCVTLINVLYASLTPRNQIVRLKGAHYYHAELFGGCWRMSLWQSVCLPLMIAVLCGCIENYFLKIYHLLLFPEEKKETHNWLHTLYKSQVSSGLRFTDDSHLAG